MKKTELVAYRTAVPNDIPLIFSSWLKGIRFGNPAYEALPSKEYYAEMHALINSILQLPETVVTVACLKDDPDTILGYSVATFESDPLDSGSRAMTLHWVFVKRAWRHIGIGGDLTPLTTTRITMVTKAVQKIVDNYPLVQVDLLRIPCQEAA